VTVNFATHVCTIDIRFGRYCCLRIWKWNCDIFLL